MKICIFCPNFKTGGAQKNSINLSNYLNKTDHSVTLIVLNDKGSLKNQLNKDIQTISLNTIRISTSILKINKYPFP